MSSPRLYFPSLPSEMGALVQIDGKQAHYLLHVMRIKTGAALTLFSNDAGVWQAEVSDCSKKTVTATLTQQLQAATSLPALTLCFSPIKPAHQATMIEKATELGIGQFQPVITEYTVIRRPNMDKLHSYAIEASEQCERPHVPEFLEPLSFSSWLASTSTPILWADESGSGTDFSALLSKFNAETYHVLIGPEGGFSDSERTQLQSHPHIHAFGLGPLVLRADTAAITSLAVLQSQLGYFKDQPRFTQTVTM